LIENNDVSDVHYVLCENTAHFKDFQRDRYLLPDNCQHYLENNANNSDDDAISGDAFYHSAYLFPRHQSRI